MADQDTPTETTPGPAEPMQTEESLTQPAASVEVEEPKAEEERNLTDHLNKRLLESFLSRLDSGAVQFPQTLTEQQENRNGEFEEP